jgi:hypothetical protein
MIVMISDFPASITMLELVRSAIGTFPFAWFLESAFFEAAFLESARPAGLLVEAARPACLVLDTRTPLHGTFRYQLRT